MINVIKRDGRKEELNLEKLHKVLEWACKDIKNVSISEIELNSEVQLYNNVKTSDIHETMIKSAANLISEDYPNYQYVAGRLINYQLRKQIYNKYDVDNLYEHYMKIMNLGFYTNELAEKYSKEEFDELNDYIDHDRDYYLTYIAMEQFRNKYLVKNRVTGELYETPQIAYILIAMTLCMNEPHNRLKHVKEFYDAVSTFDISLPTPIMAGVRTPQKQFSSCVLIESGDSIDSINATSGMILRYVSQKAGIGIGAGAIRAFGSPIRNGDAYHTGVIPYFKHFNTAVGSCSQGGVRKGSATLNYQFWHLEFEEIIELRNNKGTEETRIRTLDYCIHLNKLFYERFLSRGNITFFSPSEVPGLYDAFYEDQEKFKELYEKYEKNPKIRKKTLSAKEVFDKIVTERKDTGRIYIMNVDHVNSHSSFNEKLHPIRMTNLCVEVTISTKPLNDIHDENGRIGMCTLAAINIGKMKKKEDIEKAARILVRALNNVIDYQNYMSIAAELSTKEFRPIGIGIINLAHFLVKNNTKYSEPNLNLVHEWAEAYSYYVYKASADLAKERGAPCEKFSETKWAQGILPIDTYKKELDELVSPVYKYDWEGLRQQILETGIMNTLNLAGMPAETSAMISNSTNGFEPPRAPVSVKISKDTVSAQVVPGISKYKNAYEYLWDQPSPEGYLKIIATFQKFMDQSISTNTSYNPKFYPGREIPMSELQKHILLAYKWGIKTLYYNNTNDDAGEIEDEDICETCAI